MRLRWNAEESNLAVNDVGFTVRAASLAAYAFHDGLGSPIRTDVSWSRARC